MVWVAGAGFAHVLRRLAEDATHRFRRRAHGLGGRDRPVQQGRRDQVHEDLQRPLKAGEKVSHTLAFTRL